MPNEVASQRITLDETSISFAGLTDDEIELYLDTLNDAFEELRKRGLAVFVHPWLWDSTECLPGTLLLDFVYDRTAAVSPDTRRLFAMHVDRSPAWSEDSVGALDQVRLHGDGDRAAEVEIEPAMSLGIALASGASGRSVACLVFGASARRGFRRATGDGGTADVFFFSDPERLPDFWRSIFSRERIKESDFFDLGALAFPDLTFHPSLTFGRFDGGYLEVRDKVVQILGVINDHFAAALVEHAGLPTGVAAALGRFGVDLSPESPNTRRSSRLMAERTVYLEGVPYRCEWHAKLEPHRNRIHFSLPSSRIGNRILVGIFVSHLDT